MLLSYLFLVLDRKRRRCYRSRISLQPMPSPKILVVDDDRCYRVFLGRYLDRHGFIVENAATGNHGLDICKAFQPDMVLLDWCLREGLSGEETLKVMRTQADYRAIPVIVMSGIKQMPEDEVLIRQRGAAFFVEKWEISGSIYNGRTFLRRLKVLVLEKDLKQAAMPRLEERLQIKLDPVDRKVSFGMETSETLSRREYSFMTMLLKNHPNATTRQEIIRTLFASSRTENHALALDTFLRHLKDKLPWKLRSSIETLRGVGYQLKVAPTWQFLP